MDKIIELFSDRLDKMCKEFSEKIIALPMWQLDNILPNEFKYKSRDEKYCYLIEKFKTSNPIYLKMKSDLNLLVNGSVSLHDLQSLDLDPRYLEGLGLKKEQIIEYYRFVDKVITLLK